MNRRAQHARALLQSIAYKLGRGAVVTLNDEERTYLRGVCRKAFDGTADPLGIGKAAGGQALADDGMGEAKQVHIRIKELGTLRAACESIGAELHRDGSKSGAVEKNYRRHRAALNAADSFYAARREGTSPDVADIEAMLGANNLGK